MAGSYNYTDEDRANPVYCLACRAHIPRVLSNALNGYCTSCHPRVNVSAAPPGFSAGPVPPFAIPKPARTRLWMLPVGLVVVGLMVLGALVGKRQFLEVSADIVEHVDPLFYGDPKAAAYKALGLG